MDRALGRAAFVVELAKGAAEAFGPLKAVLESISVVYDQYRVCSCPSVQGFPLTTPLLEHCRRQGQDRGTTLTHRCA